MQTSTDHIARLSDYQLSEMIESACALAARQYADGCDTAVIDAEVDRLMAESERRGF